MKLDLRRSVHLHFTMRQSPHIAPGGYGIHIGIRWWLLWSLLLCIHTASAQAPTFSQLSNIRYKTLTTTTDSLQLDSLSIAPASLSIFGVADSAYEFYPYASLLVWKHPPACDSVRVRYRVLPLSFTQSYRHKARSEIDSNTLFYIYRQNDGDYNIFSDNSRLDYTGSYGRSISLGNQQDVALQSQFNFQANGYILDSIRLEAALTDNTLPFQPEGNTQRLQEFDQITIRLSKNKHLLQMGDYQLEAPKGYFMQYYKRVQGLYYQTEFPLNKRITQRLGVSGSIAKGQFSRNSFQGKEGNQGPYKLSGNNGELFFIVLAGTEKVYVDDQLMQRGENADYIINYNTAEITFMPRKMITKDARIQVLFEYQDKNYLNSLLYAYNEWQIGAKWQLRLDAYSNQDAKNQPYLQNLNGSQKLFLSGVGDSVHQAFYPSITRDSYATDKLLYRMTDTLVNGIHYDSVFVFTSNPDSALYALSFSYVGAHKGHYNLSTGTANGRVYDWVAPQDGIPQGSYLPAILLIAPKKQQLFRLSTQYQIDSLKALRIEVSGSNNDPNLFATKDNNTHWGLATRVQYNEQRVGNKKAAPQQQWHWQNQISYEYIQQRYKAIAPFRNVEFGRDWNAPMLNIQNEEEHLLQASTHLQQQKWGKTEYQFGYYKRGGHYQGYRNGISYLYQRASVRMGVNGNFLFSTDNLQQSQYWRPSLFAEYRLPWMLKPYIGGSYALERNAIRHSHTDSLLPAAFYFDILRAYIRTAEQQPTSWSLTYYTRRDKLPQQQHWQDQSRSQNIEWKLGLNAWKQHRINLISTYRHTSYYDTVSTHSQPEQSLLGRLDYNGNLFRNVAIINSLYEFGSGQEQRKSYTYIEVPAGQGVYTWVDYNGDGVQQSNEFEVALYPDQKRFIKVFTPTNEYVKVNYVNFNLSVLLEPGSYWEEGKKNKTQRFLSRFSSQSFLQISNRMLASEGLNAYNPFAKSLSDTTIILSNTSVGASVYFNRNSSKWGIDYNLQANTGKQLLLYGMDATHHRQHLYKLRWNIIQPISVNLQASHGNRSYAAAASENRSYQMRYQSIEPSVTWLFQNALRMTSNYKYEQRHNSVLYGGENAIIQSAQIAIRYSQPTIGALQLRGTYAGIQYNGNTAAPISFVLLDALQKGNNYLWYLNWVRQVGNGIELLLEYEGRKPGNAPVIHTGRMSIRAIL